jgi:SAM-dependent methyltransferase
MIDAPLAQNWDDDEWIDVFRRRRVWDLTLSRAQEWLAANAQFFAMVSRHVPNGGCVLELGCGPGRHAIALGLQGYRVVGVDRNPVIVSQAHANAVACGVSETVSFRVGDMGDLQAFEDQGIAAVTHGGVMEHFDSAEAVQSSLALQLKVAPVVVFDVPCGSDKNIRLFARDNIFRQEWVPDDWVERVLAPFDVVEWHIESHDAPSMTDDLVVAIRARQTLR